MPKVTNQYKDARRDQILSAARRCFLRNGFHATSMQDLFAEAGLSSGAAYRYFASKDDMIVAIAEDNMRDVVAMIHDVASRQPGRPVGTVLADIITALKAKDADYGLTGPDSPCWPGPSTFALFGWEPGDAQSGVGPEA